MYRTFRIPQLAFVGAGKLAETLTKGFIAAGALQINQIWASAPTYTPLMKLGCKTTTDNVKLVKENKLIALSVKPQVLPKVLREISPHITPDHLLLSFAAGNNSCNTFFLSFLIHINIKITIKNIYKTVNYVWKGLNLFL